MKWWVFLKSVWEAIARAFAAEDRLTDEAQRTQNAVVAVAAVSTNDADATRLHDAEATDPNNRDNG